MSTEEENAEELPDGIRYVGRRWPRRSLAQQRVQTVALDRPDCYTTRIRRRAFWQRARNRTTHCQYKVHAARAQAHAHRNTPFARPGTHFKVYE